VHTPDNWILIKIVSPEETFYKVLAGWSGGYLDGDSWRMNSGVDRVEEDGDYYLFIGASGSVYKCHKKSEMLRMNNAHIYQQLIDKHPDTVERIDYTDFIKEFNTEDNLNE
jgi:hypothetical protein